MRTRRGIFLSKKTPILYSALLLTAVNLALRLVSTSFQVYISGRIGAAGVGLVQLVLSVSGMALVAAIAGIRTTTMYLTAAELGRNRPDKVRHVLWGCIVYSCICSGFVGVLLYLLAPVIAGQWIGNEACTHALRICAYFLPVCCLCGVMTGYFTAANKIGTLAIVEIAEQAVSMGITITALSFWAKDDIGKACQSVVLGSNAGACVTLLLLTVLRFREHAPVGPKFPLRKRLLGISVPLALADDLKTGINTVENLMVPRRLQLYPAVTDPLATFGLVCGMVFPVLMFPAAIVFSLAELLIPEMARCHAAGSHIRIRYLTKKSLHVVLIYGCFFGGLLFLLAKPLCLWLYQNTHAGDHLALYATLAPMLYCDAITDAMNKGLGQQKISVRYNIFTAAMDVALLFLLLPRYGMGGYFFSFLITHAINFLLSLRLLLRTAQVRLSYPKALICLIATALAIAVCSFVFAPWIRIVSFTAVFFSLLCLLQVIGRKDLVWLLGILKRS